MGDLYTCTVVWARACLCKLMAEPPTLFHVLSSTHTALRVHHERYTSSSAAETSLSVAGLSCDERLCSILFSSSTEDCSRLTASAECSRDAMRAAITAESEMRAMRTLTLNWRNFHAIIMLTVSAQNNGYSNKSTVYSFPESVRTARYRWGCPRNPGNTPTENKNY